MGTNLSELPTGNWTSRPGREIADRVPNKDGRDGEEIAGGGGKEIAGGGAITSKHDGYEKDDWKGGEKGGEEITGGNIAGGEFAGGNGKNDWRSEERTGKQPSEKKEGKTKGE